ncbi:hypothetical protein L1987_34691 [Smallanthus sonchifolius]|uniref:Uncharacterized protein n=1 Tax=Smallanthus sonchifolius TaxID=185202 RepID=A0ACB9HVC8_9ASTR|nr:hypothetical protein L1987_34691 [Smallanthus sonchifolius]
MGFETARLTAEQPTRGPVGLLPTLVLNAVLHEDLLKNGFGGGKDPQEGELNKVNLIPFRPRSGIGLGPIRKMFGFEEYNTRRARVREKYINAPLGPLLHKYKHKHKHHPFFSFHSCPPSS